MSKDHSDLNPGGLKVCRLVSGENRNILAIRSIWRFLSSPGNERCREHFEGFVSFGKSLKFAESDEFEDITCDSDNLSKVVF